MTDTSVLSESGVSLTVNGKRRELPHGATLADLLATVGVDQRMVVVEHNRSIVRDGDALRSTRLADGDVVEIVHFVGGG